MIVAGEFDVTTSQVCVQLMDTDLTPDGGATTASRQTYVSGNAVRLAAGTLCKAISVVLAEKFDLQPERIHFSGGEVLADNHRIPSILHPPVIIGFVIEHPTRDGPYGAKGVAEIAGIPTAPAIMNAIYNAVGVRVDHMPVDHEFIWKSLVKTMNSKGNS